MAQTAFSIENVTFSGSVQETFVGEGGVPEFFSQLSVEFVILGRGPNHVAGLILTTDSWVTSQLVAATFQSFGTISGNGIEFWGAAFQSGLPVTFEFVIFCDDFGGIDSVPRIWNTNGGSVFQQSVVMTPLCQLRCRFPKSRQQSML
jgi:hypothetical protein